MATTAIDLNNVLNLEDVRLHEVNSVETYTKELRWFQKLNWRTESMTPECLCKTCGNTFDEAV